MFILGSPCRQEETSWTVKLKRALEIKTNRLNIIPALIICLITAVDNITRRKQCFTKLKRSEGYNWLMLGRKGTYFSKAFHSNWDEPHNKIKVNKSPATACCLWHAAVLVRYKRCIQKSFLSVIEDTWCERMRANFADVCAVSFCLFLTIWWTNWIKYDYTCPLYAPERLNCSYFQNSLGTFGILIIYIIMDYSYLV